MVRGQEVPHPRHPSLPRGLNLGLDDVSCMFLNDDDDDDDTDQCKKVQQYEPLKERLAGIVEMWGNLSGFRDIR